MTEAEQDAQRVKREINADLTEFHKTYYPIFAEHGFTMAEAFIGYRMNAILNTLEDLTSITDHMCGHVCNNSHSEKTDDDEADDEGEGWKGDTPKQ